jgi:undecaprenyl-diphosphatase
MTANKSGATHAADHPNSNQESPGLLSKWPIIGLSMFVLGSLIFAGMFYNLRAHEPLLQWDTAVATALPALGLRSPPIVRNIMDAGFYMGEYVIIGLGVLIGLYFIYKRFWQEFTMVAIGLIGALSLYLSLSNLIARARPPTQIWIILKIPGFPSGHATTVVVFYGLLAYLLVPKMPSTFWKGVVIAAALFLIGFVGFTRVFTGGHYLTDILAGYGVGLAWSGAAFTLIELFFQRRKRKHLKKENEIKE